MPKSPLQEPFLQELVVSFRATQQRLTRRLDAASAATRAEVVEDEMRGLYHGLLVLFDGGTALADQGLISIVDEDGNAFDRFLHERCFDYWPQS